ncbi:hypothetical protein JG688_00004981 [Phytophthora aleatoria]|uniref:Uncharacterized protein n=1 Tax=Phytophthora aleatoria TaxID=2496075 RepID=A0A8J5J8R8_9STRA|nr:hypothetical protein JG688_00004981 [Phytophthora aleatoria]
MIERHPKCLSKTCSSIGKCSVVWKVFHCTVYDKSQTNVNLHAHVRGVLPCSADHKSVVARPMKYFIAAKMILAIHHALF